MARQTRLMISFVALAAAGSLLSACDRRQAAGVPPIGSMEVSMGLETGPPPPMVYGPAAGALDPGQPIRVTALAPAPERYRYIDEAYDMVDAFDDSPPDYAFDYGGVEPWVWRSEGGYYRVAEAIPGGYREYYYGPQDDAPFLIRDPRYAYAYDGGALVAVYDIHGRVQPAAFVVRQADYAGRYYARARTLHYAALHQERRRPYADQWRASRQALAAPRQNWARARDRDAEWRRLREQRPNVQPAVWSQERQRREVTRRAEQTRGPDRPAVQAQAEHRAPPPVRAAHDERRGHDRGPAQDQRRAVEAPRQVQRAEAAQQHAAQASAREVARRGMREQHLQQQGERRRAAVRQGQAQQQPAQAWSAERIRGRAPEERVRAEPRQDRPQRLEAPNAQAHARPAVEQRERGPAQHGGPGKGGERGPDKHDRR
jgi:hypothetical protein